MNAGKWLKYASLMLGMGYSVTPTHLPAQEIGLELMNRNRPMLDSHNCYPYDGRWGDRIDRALRSDFPVGIEQDIAWYVDPNTGEGRAVVSHSDKTTGADPSLREYFFERVRPIVEKALAEGNRSQWPMIVVHFDFKDNQAPLLRAVWKVLGEYQSWITTARKMADPHTMASFDPKPLLVLTEDSDAQERVFFNEIPVGSTLRLFGSAHTNVPAGNKQERIHFAATLPPSDLLTERPTDYRRWWNNAWSEVEEGGQQQAGPWTPADNARLRALVEHAHNLGYWIRFYTLDGFDPATGDEHGWFEQYNFGSLVAAQERWKAAIDEGVNLIATDQYEDLSRVMRNQRAQK
jgi:hypothetical protein